MGQRNDDELMAAAWAGQELTAEEQDRAKRAFATHKSNPNSLGGRLLQGLARATMSTAKAKPRNHRTASMPWSADEDDPRNRHSAGGVFYDGAGYPVDANGTRLDND